MAASEALVGAAVVAPVLDVPAAARATLVNEARATLLRSATAVTIAQLAEATGRSAEAARKWSGRKSKEGRLAVVHLHDGTMLIPTIQLDEAFALNEEVAERTRRLVAWGMGPWAIWDWWQTPNGWLHDNRSPADAVRAGHLDAVDRAIDGLIQ
ncbi:MAG: hypothetical protein R6V28_00870 [Nitriliruptoraceae bacterium]